MKLADPRCPVCGEPATGTVEALTGVAFFSGDPSVEDVEYGGTTEIDWNGQHTKKEDGKPIVTCDSGHQWATVIGES